GDLSGHLARGPGGRAHGGAQRRLGPGPRRRGTAAAPPTGSDSLRAARRGNPSRRRGDRRPRSPGADERPDPRHEHPRLEWTPGPSVSYEAAAAGGQAPDRDLPAHGAACRKRSDGSSAGRAVNMPADLRETKSYQWMFDRGRLDGVIEGRLNKV